MSGERRLRLVEAAKRNRREFPRIVSFAEAVGESRSNKIPPEPRGRKWSARILTSNANQYSQSFFIPMRPASQHDDFGKADRGGRVGAIRR